MNEIKLNEKGLMSSLDFLNEIINPIREEMGESKIQNRHFLLKIEDEIDDLGAGIFITRYGNKVKVYDLNYDQMMIVGMRESKSVRRNVLEKLKQLDKKPQFAIPQTLSEALQLASDQAKQLELQAPKVNYYDKVAKNTTHLNATQVAQKVGLSAVTMNKHLTELKVYNKSIKRGKAFNQWFIDEGYGEMKQTELGYSQAVFTVKGEQYIIELLTSEGIV